MVIILNGTSVTSHLAHIHVNIAWFIIWLVYRTINGSQAKYSVGVW